MSDQWKAVRDKNEGGEFYRVQKGILRFDGDYWDDCLELAAYLNALESALAAEREKSMRRRDLLAIAHVMFDPAERARTTKEGRERFINEVADVLLEGEVE